MAQPQRVRIESIDVVRGDHHASAVRDPLDHALLRAGVLPAHRRRCADLARPEDRGELSRFLGTRGLWLIVLETIVMRCLSYQFNVDFQLTGLVVLWMLGWSMIALSALIYLPSAAIAILGAVLIAGHNLLDGVPAETFGAAAPVWKILHIPGPLVSGTAHDVFV